MTDVRVNRVMRFFVMLLRETSTFSLIGFLCLVAACQRRSDSVAVESSVATTDLASRNAGFRILPTMAARDAQRPRVIYRCNEVACGEAFQPSNEERDMFFSCSLASSLGLQGKVPPYMRVVNVQGQQKLIEKKEHMEACTSPLSFEKVLATPESPTPAQTGNVEGEAKTCRRFKANRAACEENFSQGCRWVTHPSGRSSASPDGDCIGLLKSDAPASGEGKTDSFQLTTNPVPWAPLESYRSAQEKGLAAPK